MSVVVRGDRHSAVELGVIAIVILALPVLRESAQRVFFPYGGCETPPRRGAQ